MTGTPSPTQQRRRQRFERLETLMEMARLGISRHLRRAGASHLERAEVRTMLVELLDHERDRDARLAVDDGESFAAIGRALGITRQAAFKRYGHLRDDPQ